LTVLYEVAVHFSTEVTLLSLLFRQESATRRVADPVEEPTFADPPEEGRSACSIITGRDIPV
jgi:hypothetical protein